MAAYRLFLSTLPGRVPQPFRLDPPYLDPEEERPLRDEKILQVVQPYHPSLS